MTQGLLLFLILPILHSTFSIPFLTAGIVPKATLHKLSVVLPINWWIFCVVQRVNGRSSRLFSQYSPLRSDRFRLVLFVNL